MKAIDVANDFSNFSILKYYTSLNEEEQQIACVILNTLVESYSSIDDTIVVGIEDVQFEDFIIHVDNYIYEVSSKDNLYSRRYTMYFARLFELASESVQNGQLVIPQEFLNESYFAVEFIKEYRRKLNLAI